MISKYEYVQIIGFVIIVAALWRFISVEAAVVTATIVAIWEFLKPSRNK